MVNIVIKETNPLFQCGLTAIFNDIFGRESESDIFFDFSLTCESVRKADILVLSLCPGEYFTCFPELHERQKSIVIGFTENDTHVNLLPSCFQDIILISRRATLLQVRLILLNAWYNIQRSDFRLPPITCSDCQQKTFSPQQIRIMIGLYKGLSVMQIADEMMVNSKTIYSHKYQVMAKFNLRSDYELMLLVNRLAEKNSWSTIFYDYLQQ